MKLVQTNASVVEDGVNVTLYVHFPGASSYAIADLAVEAFELALLSLKGDTDDTGTGADRASDNDSSGGQPDDGGTVNDGDTAGGDPSVDDSPVPVSDGSDSEGRTEEVEQVSDVELTKALNQATSELGMEATKAEIVKRVGAGEKPTISNIPQGARKNLMSTLKQMIDSKGGDATPAPAAPAKPRRGRRR